MLWHTQFHEFMMNMIFVRQKRIFPNPQPMYYHTHHNKHWYHQKRKGNNNRPWKSGILYGIRHAESDGHGRQQHTYGERARITHKYLTASAHLAKHIIIEEWYQHAKGRESQKGINPPTQYGKHTSKGNECNNAQTRSQPIDAIYQIDGIHDEHYNLHCEWPSHPLWNVTDTEYSIKIGETKPCCDQEYATSHLQYKFGAITH